MTKRENESHAGVLTNSNVASEQEFTRLDSRTGLIKRLFKGVASRTRFVDSHLSKGMAFQIQSMRESRGWSQEELARRLGTNRMGVYRLENPNYGRQTLTTLKKVAATFDVALIIRFVAFSQLVDWVTATPRVDKGLNEDALEVPGFQEELKNGHFDQLLMPPQQLPTAKQTEVPALTSFFSTIGTSQEGTGAIINQYAPMTCGAGSSATTAGQGLGKIAPIPAALLRDEGQSSQGEAA